MNSDLVFGFLSGANAVIGAVEFFGMDQKLKGLFSFILAFTLFITGVVL